jgi:hypothetical protein
MADCFSSAQAALARAEIEQARAMGQKSPLNCAAEAKELGHRRGCALSKAR